MTPDHRAGDEPTVVEAKGRVVVGGVLSKAFLRVLGTRMRLAKRKLDSSKPLRERRRCKVLRTTRFYKSKLMGT